MTKDYPSVGIVHGILDDVQLIEKEASASNVVIRKLVVLDSSNRR